MKPGFASSLSVLLLVCMIGCESRDRINPFDPGNPNTGGTPSLLDAQAGNGYTTLHWDVGGFEKIQAVRLYRRLYGVAIKPLTPSGLDPSVKFYEDLSAQNGVRYEYRLELELISGGLPVSDWDLATPGTAIPWIADGNGGGLSRLTPDGRDQVRRIGAGLWFLDLAADSVGSAIWSVDYLEGNLYQHAWNGTELLKVRVAGARAVDVDFNGASIWVGSFDQRRLEERDREGELVWADDEAGTIEDLLAVEPRGVWLCNQEGEIRLYRDSAFVTSFGGLERPVALARSREGRFLVLERGAKQVRRIDPTGIPEETSDRIFSDPLDLCRDEGMGAWVADPERGGLVHLDDEMEEIGFVPVEGVLGITWDDRDEHIWVVGTGGLQVLDSSGEHISGRSLGPRPVKIELLHDLDTL